MACDYYNCRGCSNETIDEKKTNCSPWSCDKLSVYDWLSDLPMSENSFDIVEIRFKNTRKDFYKNVNKLNLAKGDIVAVEASPGHDIGTISLVGDLVKTQLTKSNTPFNIEFKKIYRKAKPNDIEKWHRSISFEDEIMFEARRIASDLKLSMKIGDVEYQGDKTKAIFYYIAEERVDFRQLIKILAERFRIRVEMRQIGARQEAGRIGGIGSCGRELCCSTWITNFVSVTTNSARYQELSLNPQKLAGQCGKLKCCLNYELDCYIDAQKDFPPISQSLRTEKGVAIHQKTDIYKRIMWYSYDNGNMATAVPVPVDRVQEIIKLNKNGEKVFDLIDKSRLVIELPKLDYKNVVGEDSLTRFDNATPKKKKKKRRKKPANAQSQQKTSDNVKSTNDEKTKPKHKPKITPKLSEENEQEQKPRKRNFRPKNKARNKPKHNSQKPNNEKPKGDTPQN